MDSYIKKIMQIMGLGEVLEIESVKGGLLHTMYKVKTELDTYAIKILNPCIMEREEAMTNYINSEKIACALEDIVSLISGLKWRGNTIICMDSKYCMVFPWQEGESIFPPYINKQHCLKIGEILGKIHSTSLAYLNIPRERYAWQQYSWEVYLQTGKEQNATWTIATIELIQQLKYWEEIANRAAEKLSENTVLSHRDLDPKNVMWYKDKAYIIDWEAAGYINPFEEFIDVIYYWGQDESGELVKEQFDAIKESYSRYIDLSSTDWQCVVESGYLGKLGWLNYNCRRSLGIECTTEIEKILGTQQVIATLNELKQYENQSKQLLQWLT